ncbi:MAG: GAF domain-containing protein [Chloroflexi bacterium]|nr:GAF domain-containing protein [Chloroflexota bacterium]
MDYRQVLAQIKETIDAARTGEEAAATVIDYLHDHFDHHSWVGIYWVRGQDLVLGPWKGPQATEHTRIPIGTGVCGAAAASGMTEVVDDVSKDARYLACFPSTKSEIVVPIIADGRVLGEIDIDSDRLAAFTPEDREFLEGVAVLLAPVRGRSA